MAERPRCRCGRVVWGDPNVNKSCYLCLARIYRRNNYQSPDPDYPTSKPGTLWPESVYAMRKED